MNKRWLVIIDLMSSDATITDIMVVLAGSELHARDVAREMSDLTLEDNEIQVFDVDKLRGGWRYYM